MATQRYNGAGYGNSADPSNGLDEDEYQSMVAQGGFPNPPPGDSLLSGYKGAVGEYEGHMARNSRLRGSALLNINDPISLHLLVETALGDSVGYEVLSFEELESLKREETSLSSRVERVRRQLALESKMRDAAQSLSRLDSGGLGVNGSQQSNAELKAVTQKCEDLSRDLWQMETRYRQVQTALLRHTAGVLQMTHEGPTSKQQIAQSMLPDSMRRGGRPDSPASIYTYDATRSRDPFDGDEGFDERSAYRTTDNIDGLVDPARHGKRGGLHNRTTSIPALPSSGAGMLQLASIEKRLANMNHSLRDLIVQANPDRDSGYASPPKASAADSDIDGGDSAALDSQIDYLDKGLQSMSERQRQQLMAMDELERMQARNSGGDEKAERYETVLAGLWELMISSEEEARERKRMRRQTLAATSPGAEDGDLSPDEDYNPNETFSIESFSHKVQWLQRRATNFKEQQSILRRQIKQQRDLNSKSDAEKDQETSNLSDQIATLTTDLTNLRMHNDVLQTKVGDTAALEAESEERAALEQKLRSDITTLEHALAESKQDLHIAQTEHSGSSTELAALTSRLHDAEQQKSKAESELSTVESEMIRLQTELTVSKAELDAAYGTRAQRAAEVATNPEIQQKVSTLETESASLKAELRDTIAEFEELTKSTIEAEKEREKLEAGIDSLRDRCEALEVQLADEKVRQLGSPGGPAAGGSTGGSGSGADATKTAVLKDAFKKMMRETRAEHMKALRAEQEERRRLEASIRQMRKEQAEKLKQTANATGTT